MRFARFLAVLAAGAVIAGGVVGTAGASGPTASTSGSRVLLISNCKKAKFQPPTVIITCGDAGLIASGLTWSQWGKKVAQGTGTGEIKVCKPDCASGKTKSAPIALVASKPQMCSNGRRVFSKLRYTWTDKAPVGPDSGSVPIGCKLSGL